MERTLDPENEQVTFTQKKLKRGDVETIDQPQLPNNRLTIHDLPPELLIEIFSWFSVRELFLTISPVSKAWHLFSQNNCLWKHLSFKGSGVTTERLCLLLSHATQLQSLQLVDREDATAVLEQVALSNQRLQILIVQDCKGSQQQSLVQEEVLIRLIKRCSKLEEINMKRTNFYSETFFKGMGIALPDLKRLNFNYNGYFGSRCLNIIACNCKPLEEVSVYWFKSSRYHDPNDYETPINDNDINELCTRMKNSLKILKIPANELTNMAMKSIVQCTCLLKLSIIGARCLTDDGILLLTTLHNLCSLRFGYADRISSEGWQEMFIRSKWKSLRKLSFIACVGIDDTSLDIIGETCPNLQKSGLTNCTHFTQDGVSKLIKACKELTCLTVEWPKTNVYKCFALIPTYTPNMKYLEYDCHNISVPKKIMDDALKLFHDLQMKLPNLNIVSSLLS